MEKEYFIAGQIVHRIIEAKRSGKKSIYHGISNELNIGEIMSIILRYCSNISFKVEKLKYGYKLIILLDNMNKVINNYFII